MENVKFLFEIRRTDVWYDDANGTARCYYWRTVQRAIVLYRVYANPRHHRVRDERFAGGRKERIVILGHGGASVSVVQCIHRECVVRERECVCATDQVGDEDENDVCSALDGHSSVYGHGVTIVDGIDVFMTVTVGYWRNTAHKDVRGER